MEAGLGESEAFYSWVITLFNIGALIGAILCGFLVKFIPYWHLILLSLLAHTAGYVIYAVTYEGWLIMISKLLSGFFIGAEMALALSYFAESSMDYEELMRELGKKSSRTTLRNSLFALHNIGVNIGYIFGPGKFIIVLFYTKKVKGSTYGLYLLFCPYCIQKHLKWSLRMYFLYYTNS